MSNDRFKTLYQKGVVTRHVVIVDSETGVNYLFVCEASAGGLTVLLDKDGKPLVTPVEK
ncbi:DUF6440 family protein [Clostridium manihotivorum]|uniref:DUF6440 family protein n=1 Tax=Clostridium manihotivorum TaxID=2320868 RepID=UPI0013E2F9D4|nr:DUF6440 family protein [Clostridium manihotivorum]